MIVSHDRRFLDTMTTRTFELSGGSLVEYAGNWSFSHRPERNGRLRLQAALRNQQQQIKQTERFIERFRYKATKARQVQSRIKQLEKLERVRWKTMKTKFLFLPAALLRPAKSMLELRKIRKQYGTLQVFDGVRFRHGPGRPDSVRRGERCGKVNDGTDYRRRGAVRRRRTRARPQCDRVLFCPASGRGTATGVRCPPDGGKLRPAISENGCGHCSGAFSFQRR